jgi:hypothetical protein
VRDLGLEHARLRRSDATVFSGEASNDKASGVTRLERNSLEENIICVMSQGRLDTIVVINTCDGKIPTIQRWPATPTAFCTNCQKPP